ncbi:MAG: bifunctional helix-turn-helix transcriptional regulator/GNAT family N-acetyltransferase [Xanthobacteraceae bacterium]
MPGRIANPGASETAAAPDRIATVRGFNRFYTRQIGVLRKTFLDSPYSLGEARVLYEIARGNGSTTATDIGRALDLDTGYLSRLLRNFEKRGLIRRTAAANDARQSHLTLSARGRSDFAPLDQSSQRDIGAMLDRLTPDDQLRLIAAMDTIQTLLGGQPDTASAPERSYRLRAPRPGDFGWIVKRHAELYAQEYGWTEPFEGVCAQIVADFANNNVPRRERCWIVEMDGETVGCVFLVADSDTVARIRLLLVDPKARGLKLGARLVAECIALARRAGYQKITLWTHSVLTAARHIYQQAGFTLTSSEERVSFGKPVVSEYWDLQL